MNHISEHDLERFHLGMVDETALALIEEHLLWCSLCIDAAVEAAQYVDTIRAQSFVEISIWSSFSSRFFANRPYRTRLWTCNVFDLGDSTP